MLRGIAVQHGAYLPCNAERTPVGVEFCWILLQSSETCDPGEWKNGSIEKRRCPGFCCGAERIASSRAAKGSRSSAVVKRLLDAVALNPSPRIGDTHERDNATRPETPPVRCAGGWRSPRMDSRVSSRSRLVCTWQNGRTHFVRQLINVFKMFDGSNQYVPGIALGPVR